MSSFFSYLRNTSECQDIARDFYANGYKRSLGIVPSTPIWQLILMLLLLAVFTGLTAVIFNYIRKTIYKDKDNLDTDFNAGGNVSLGLTATTITSQWIWAATFLTSSGLVTVYGVILPLWFAAGLTIPLLLFSMLSVQFKIRAPGAKTFLQVIWSRFGPSTHIVFVVFALLCNMIVLALLMAAGSAIMTNLVEGLTIELATFMTAIVIGVYPFIGGLGATFYVSYFNTAITFAILIVFMAKVLHEPQEGSPVGRVENLYPYLNCSQGPVGNTEESFITTGSQPSFEFGVILVVNAFATLFLDQSYWQSIVAARPTQGVWGFLSAGLVWFAIPFTFGTVIGSSYIALSAQQGEALLNPADVDAGLVPAIVAQRLMGEAGELLLIFVILMAVTSTGAAEVMAVSSIVVYDIYMIYVKPYRKVHDVNTCVLCGRARGRNATPANKCLCISMRTCQLCHDDTKTKQAGGRFKPEYKCKMHGPYREYNDYLLNIKSWTLLWSTLAIIPLTLIMYVLNISMGWMFMFIAIIIGSAVVPIALCMFWARVNAAGMISGAIGGLVLALASWLAMTSQEPGGFSYFLANSGTNRSALAGDLVAIGAGGIICIIVSFITNRKYDAVQAYDTWEKTRDIDNPLVPWSELFARNCKQTPANRLDNRPSLQDVSMTFRFARISAYVGSISLTLIILFIWPGAMQAVGMFDETTFKHWVNVTQAWAIIATIYIIVLPLVNEIIEIRAAIKERKSLKLEMPADYEAIGQVSSFLQNFASLTATIPGKGQANKGSKGDANDVKGPTADGYGHNDNKRFSTRC